MMIKYSQNHQNLFTMKNADVRPSLLLYGLVTQVFVHIISLVDLHTQNTIYNMYMSYWYATTKGLVKEKWSFSSLDHDKG